MNQYARDNTGVVMLGKWIDAWAKDLQRGCFYQFIAAVTIIPLIIILIIIPFYFASQPGISQTEFLIIILLPAMAFLLVSIGGGWGAALLIIRRRLTWVDKIFTGLSLKGKMLNITGRQFHGEIKGREVDVLYQRGPILTIYIGTEMMTRLSVSDSGDIIRGIAHIFHQEPIYLAEEGLTIYAHDHIWANRFLDTPGVRERLRDLIFDEHPFLVRQILIIPGRLMLRYYRSKQDTEFQFTAEQVDHWMASLLELAGLADNQQRPREELPVSEIHEKARKATDNSLGWVIAGVIAVLMLVVLAVAVGLIYLI